MRIAVIADSTFWHNKGAARTTVVRELEAMLKDGGLPDVEVVNFAVPGMNWKAAKDPTPGLLYGGNRSPLQAVHSGGPWDWIFVCLGVNDRQNPNATEDAKALRDALPPCNQLFIRQHFYNELAPTATVVTKEEGEAMQATYDALGGEQTGISYWIAYDLGMTYDRLHPTDTGKHWMASALYIGLQGRLPLTESHWNLGRLWAARTENPQQYQMVRKIAE